MIKCPYFGECGGCSLQNLEYCIQIESKRKELINSIGFDDIKIFSGKEFEYRNRMDLLFTEKGLGIRKKGRWDKTIDIEQCLICNEKLNGIMIELRNFFKNVDYFDLKKHIGTFRYAVIRTPRKDSSISFVLNSKSNKLNEAIEKIKEFSKITNVEHITITYVPPNTEMSISDDYFMVKGSDFLKEEYLDKTYNFYKKHGGKTIILARFIPIVRTFAPFIAGVGKMDYIRFLSFNVIGGIIWVAIFIFSGYWFGNIPFIKNNLSITVIIIILVSLIPAIIEYIKHKKK